VTFSIRLLCPSFIYRSASRCPSETAYRLAYYLTDVNGAEKVEQVAEERDLGILITDEIK